MRKRYPSDVTDAQWARIATLFEDNRRGRPRHIQARELLNAIFYVMKNGCAWRALHHDFPKWQTVFVQRKCWTRQGLLARAAEHLRPPKHRRVLGHVVLPANQPDAVGARVLIPEANLRFPSLRLVLGDKAYRQRPLQAQMVEAGVVLDGDSPPLPKGTIFQPMPTRWRVEQFFAWFCKWRRIAKNWCYRFKGFSADVGWVLLGLTLRRPETYRG